MDGEDQVALAGAVLGYASQALRGAFLRAPRARPFSLGLARTRTGRLEKNHALAGQLAPRVLDAVHGLSRGRLQTHPNDKERNLRTCARSSGANTPRRARVPISPRRSRQPTALASAHGARVAQSSFDGTAAVPRRHRAPSMGKRRFHDVTRYGAVGDGVSDSTEAIAAAIAAASQAAAPGKHAVVKFTKGTFLTRPFNLSSWLIVEIQGTIKGATGNAAVRRWPRLPPLPSYGRDRDLTCTYGHPAKRQRYQALVFAADAQHLIIRGRGAIDGQGAWWWERAGCKGSGCRKKRAAIRAGRPHLLELYNCSHVEVSPNPSEVYVDVSPNPSDEP